MARVYPTLIERFWSRVEKSDVPNACWNWTKSTSNRYGVLRVTIDGVKILRPAHRLSYEIHYGEIPPGMCVCHRCDNPSCVNPAHLFLGTHEENMHDKGRKGRGRGAKGVTNGAHKLSEESVREIRRRYATGTTTQDVLAREFGVSSTTIRNIVKRLQWQYLTDAA